MDRGEEHVAARHAIAWLQPERAALAAAAERAEVAGTLHDDAVQPVIAARMRIERLLEGIDPERSDALEIHLEFIDRQLTHALEAMRAIIAGGTMPEAPCANLAEALDSAVQDARDAWGLEVVVTCTGDTERPTRMAPVAHRILLEALRNVGKHARTNLAAVSATIDDQEISISIRDRGCGFTSAVHLRDAGDQELGGYGLHHAADVARRHQGRLSIDSTPSVGTSVRLRLPATPR